jgi:hypothetical protein
VQELVVPCQGVENEAIVPAGGFRKMGAGGTFPGECRSFRSDWHNFS